MLSYAVFTALKSYQIIRPKTPFCKTPMLWALFAVDLEAEVRQTPFSALLPLCGIRYLSPGLSFPSGKVGAPKNKLGGRARALGPSHSLVLCGGGPSCLHSGLQYRTLQATKAQILAKMAVEEPDWRPEWCSELRADPSLHRNRQAVGVNRWAPLPKPEGQGLHQAWMLRSECFKKETMEFKWISLKLVIKDESEYMIQTRRPVSALLTGRILNGLKLIG